MSLEKDSSGVVSLTVDTGKKHRNKQLVFDYEEESTRSALAGVRSLNKLVTKRPGKMSLSHR